MFYFHYLQKASLDQCIQKLVDMILKTKVLMCSWLPEHLVMVTRRQPVASEAVFQIKSNVFLDTLILTIIFFDKKIK